MIISPLAWDFSPHRIKGCQGFSQLIWETMRLRPKTSRSIDVSISLFSLIFSNVLLFSHLTSQMSEREKCKAAIYDPPFSLPSLKDRTFGHQTLLQSKDKSRPFASLLEKRTWSFCSFLCSLFIFSRKPFSSPSPLLLITITFVILLSL